MKCQEPNCRETDDDPGILLRCAQCKQWFCDTHIDTTHGVNLMRERRTGKTFFQAVCYPCERGLVP